MKYILNYGIESKQRHVGKGCFVTNNLLDGYRQNRPRLEWSGFFYCLVNDFGEVGISPEVLM